MARCLCGSCKQPIEYADDMAGQTAGCPSCGQPTTLGPVAVAVVNVPAQVEGRQESADEAIARAGEVAGRIIDNIECVIIGKRPKIVLTLMSMLAEGHVLLEDVPGVAKTMLARALAQSIGCNFKRVQCTPDLLPGDITGSSIFNPKTSEFEFRPGPLFAQIVLADEINRATPRTQSALLEAMAEKQVSADGVNYPLESPFFIIATQNPVDHEGTFPLPEAQLDRFLVRLGLGYPAEDEEDEMLERFQFGHPISTLQPVATAAEVVACQQAARRVQVDAKVREYILQIVRATRGHEAIILGASPRASMAIFRATQTLAMIQGCDFVLPDDVKQVASAVLAHRLIVKPESRLRKITTAGVIEEILMTIPVPTMDATSRRD